MSDTLNIYRHADGHYVLVPGPPLDTMPGDNVAWLGSLHRSSFDPELLRGIEAQLLERTCATITAEQFYAPSNAQLLAPQH